MFIPEVLKTSHQDFPFCLRLFSSDSRTSLSYQCSSFLLYHCVTTEKQLSCALILFTLFLIPPPTLLRTPLKLTPNPMSPILFMCYKKKTFNKNFTTWSRTHMHMPPFQSVFIQIYVSSRIERRTKKWRKKWREKNEKKMINYLRIYSWLTVSW